MKIFTRGWSIALVAIIATFVGSGVSAGPPSSQCDFTGIYPGIAGGGFFARLDLATWDKLHPTLTPTAQTVADLDGNGVADVIATFTGLGTWKSVNGGAWEAITVSEASWYAVGDLNGNGHDDLVMAFEGVDGTFKYMGATSTLTQTSNLTPTLGTTSNLDGDVAGTDEAILVYEDGDASVEGIYKWSEPLGTYTKILNNVAASMVGTGNVNGSASGEGNVLMTFASPTGTFVYQDVNPYYTLFTNLTATALTSGDILNAGGGGQQIVLATDQDYEGSPIEGTWILENYATSAWGKIYNEAATVMNGNCNLDNTGGDDIAVTFATQPGTFVYLNDSSYVQQTTEDATSLAVGVLD